MNISNDVFLKTLFQGDKNNVHVTDFIYDPNEIPKDRHLISWKGDYFSKYQFEPNSNQYFTISIFNSDEYGVARRRKALFIKTPVIVLDDVKEKLSMDEVSKLPIPSYILETSPGSEQWGYILNEPCTNRHKVENLLDGLVANGLAPDGKDPGMKGVTRYVRLPEGYNTKKSKMVNCKPFKCQIIQWRPFNHVTIEELAKPFNVNLDAPRKEQTIEGAADIPDHPLLHCGLNIKEVRSDGRFDITCPWVDEHTGAVDNGAAIFTNKDGSPGFKCHHGACEGRTGNDLIRLIEHQSPGFQHRYNEWKFKRLLIGYPQTASKVENKESSLTINHNNQETKEPDTQQEILEKLRSCEPGSKESRSLVSQFLKLIDSLPEIDKVYLHQEVCDVMGWSKVDFTKILRDLRESWYESTKEASFYDNMIYIREQNLIYDHFKRMFYTAESFQNSFGNEDIDARKQALTNNKIKKVDKLDFVPKKPLIFEEEGITFINTWNNHNERKGTKGDVSRWLDHWKTLGWEENQKHMLQWMAYTILHPENKINHILLLGGREGTGKDYLLYPLLKAMGKHSEVVDGHELLSSFADYILNFKHIHINETELGDHKEATTISNKLKPLAAAPPETLRVNVKNKTPMKVRNIVNLTMTTNSQMPVKMNETSRRYYAVWSDFNQRDSQNEVLPQWKQYWKENWEWMFKEGVDHCIWYLRNCVDLSDFEPGSPPPITEFLNSIHEESKSPAQQTIEAFIENKIGAFASDIVTTNEACATLKVSGFGFDEFMYMDSKWFTPVKVGRIMKDIQTCVKLRARNEIELKVWVIRNKEKYEKMTSFELHSEYNKQLKQRPIEKQFK